jgi:hypothetical protein
MPLLLDLAGPRGAYASTTAAVQMAGLQASVGLAGTAGAVVPASRGVILLIPPAHLSLDSGDLRA